MGMQLEKTGDQRKVLTQCWASLLHFPFHCLPPRLWFEAHCLSFFVLTSWGFCFKKRRMFSHLKLSIFLVHQSLLLLIFQETLMALHDARKSFNLNEECRALVSSSAKQERTDQNCSSPCQLEVAVLCPEGSSALLMLDLKVTRPWSPHQQVHQCVQQKTLTQRMKGGIWLGVTSAWAGFLVSAFKNWCIFICHQEYEFSSPEWGLFEPCALLHMYFFPPLLLKKGIFPGLELLGFWGAFFWTGNVNRMPQPLLREAVESSYVDS